VDEWQPLDAGELPIAYASGVMNFPKPMRLQARRRHDGAGSGEATPGVEAVPAEAS